MIVLLSIIASMYSFCNLNKLFNKHLRLLNHPENLNCSSGSCIRLHILWTGKSSGLHANSPEKDWLEVLFGCAVHVLGRSHCEECCSTTQYNLSHTAQCPLLKPLTFFTRSTSQLKILAFYKTKMLKSIYVEWLKPWLDFLVANLAAILKQFYNENRHIFCSCSLTARSLCSDKLCFL